MQFHLKFHLKRCQISEKTARENNQTCESYARESYFILI